MKLALWRSITPGLLKSETLTRMKEWVKSFQRFAAVPVWDSSDHQRPLPYLPSEEIRKELFPLANVCVVVDHLETVPEEWPDFIDPSTEAQTMDLSDGDEDHLLSDPLDLPVPPPPGFAHYSLAESSADGLTPWQSTPVAPPTQVQPRSIRAAINNPTTSRAHAPVPQALRTSLGMFHPRLRIPDGLRRWQNW